MFFTVGLEESQKTALCLSGPACFAMSSINFGKFEEGIIGVDWDTMHETYQKFKFATALYMMFIDSLIYIVLAYENNNVFFCLTFRLAVLHIFYVWTV